MEKDDIRVFLQSPNSLEPASETDLNKKQPRQAKKPRRKRQIKENLQPYYPLKSIYLETDFTKLTERQKILALKYQANFSQANPLFLAVNNLEGQTPISKKRQNKSDSNENSTFSDRNKDYETDTKKNKSKKEKVLIKKDAKLKKEKSIANNAVAASQKCAICYHDSFELLEFLIWLEDAHKCKLVEKIQELKKFVSKFIDNKDCICAFEKDVFLKATEIAKEKCCL